MVDEPAESARAAESSPTAMRFRADACRVLAETDVADRKSLWLKRAAYWDELALKAAERLLDSVKAGRPAAG